MNQKLKMGKRKNEEEETTKTAMENGFSSLKQTVISDNIGSVETYYQLNAAHPKVVLEWCMEQGLIASGFFCPKCHKSMLLTPKAGIGDKYTWSCRVFGQNAHYIKRSVRIGSWFERSSLPMPTILLFLIYWCLEMKTKFICEQLNISPNTATVWANFCREVCLDILICQSDKIGGDGISVEIYETEFSERKYHQIKKAEGNRIFAGVEKGTNNCFLAVVENSNSENLLSVIEKHILPGTEIISDCWKTYDCLSQEGFKHLKINLSMTFVTPKSAIHKNFIDSIWRDIKRSLHYTHYIQGQFDSYLAEYLWRKINSTAASRMKSLIEIIKDGYPLRTNDALSFRQKYGKQSNNSTDTETESLNVSQ